MSNDRKNQQSLVKVQIGKRLVKFHFLIVRQVKLVCIIFHTTYPIRVDSNSTYLNGFESRNTRILELK